MAFEQQDCKTFPVKAQRSQQWKINVPETKLDLMKIHLGELFLAPPIKSDQQQKNGMPVAKSKKRQPVTPTEDFQDSDPEDDYEKS